MNKDNYNYFNIEVFSFLVSFFFFLAISFPFYTDTLIRIFRDRNLFANSTINGLTITINREKKKEKKKCHCACAVAVHASPHFVYKEKIYISCLLFIFQK